MLGLLRRRRRGGGSGDAPQASELAAKLQREVERLQLENQQLQEKLLAKDVITGETLFQWRAGLPLLGPAWEQKFCVLSGTQLKLYKSEKDVIFSPREEYSTLGVCVEYQGLVERRWWAWALVDTGGNTLCRLAARTEDVAHKWVAALAECGCEVRDVQGDSEAQPGASGLANVVPRSLSLPHMQRNGDPFAGMGSTGRAAFSPAGAGYSAGDAYRIGRTSTAGAGPIGAGGTGGLGSPTGGLQTARLRSFALRVTGGEEGAQRLVTGGAPTSEPQAAVGAAGLMSPGGGAAAATGAGVSGGRVGATSPVPGASPRSSLGYPPGGAAGVRGGVTSHEEAHAAGLHGETAAGGAGVHQQHTAGAAAAKPVRRGPMSGSTPVHTAPKASYLSSERMWNEKHTGLYNLLIVIVVSTNFRLALENALKYGWRYNPLGFFGRLTIGNPNIPLALCYPTMAMMAVLALLLELLGASWLAGEVKLHTALVKRAADEGLGEEEAEAYASRRLSRRIAVHEGALLTLNIINTCAALIVPWVTIYVTRAEPVSGGVLIMLAVVLWMKLVSFHHCCADLRTARRRGELRPGERGSPGSPAEWALLQYPENLTLGNLAYYMAAPTLSYQVNYPRSPSIRKKWLARRVAELVVMLTLLSLIVAQYVEPSVANSMGPLKEMNWARLTERVLKLALPNMYCWLVMFYSLFHLWLNILAELLRFGDREFYQDWWNSSDVGQYWKLWNLPVHRFLLRHVYYPALRFGLSRWPAMILVFFVSAVFHELVLGVPLHMVRLWAFTGIMLQVPLILLTDWVRKKLNRDEAGNIVFWLTFCVVGQPLTVLLYYHDFLYEVMPRVAQSPAASSLLHIANATSPALGA